MRIRVEVRGDEAAERRLRNLADNANDGRRFFRRVQRLVTDRARAHWRGKPGWAPLDPDTVRRKARQGQSPQILRVTGALQRAMTVWGASGQRAVIRNDELVFGIDPSGPVSYGIYHHTGRGVPRRPIIPEIRSLRGRIRDAMYDHLFGR